MATERAPEYGSHVPPLWWHDAIRNNVEGFQVTKFKFESLERVSDNGISHTIFSITPGDPSGLKQEIYIKAKMQMDLNAIDPKLITPILYPIINLFNKEAEKLDVQNVQPISARNNAEIASWGYTANTASSVGLTFQQKDSEFLVIHLSSLTPEQIKNSPIPVNKIDEAKENLIREYFIDTTYFQRIKIVFSDEISLPLKKEILRVEMRIGRAAIKQFEEKLEVVEEPENNQFYRLILGKILGTVNDKEEKALAKELKGMGTAKQIGWLKFYENYWSEKLGLEFTDLQSP
ncbi:MAG TPA: hypothetical protein VKC54_03440 [Patescibacteria group bacterium]|nr:hypothetical protein [Patescibacteria group bacterium]